MCDRVLLVDDDPMLLSSMERCLGLKFDLTTALSGPEALRTMESIGPFGVIMTDMRMPVMDGVQFIERARMISPHSVYLMLTGNQDLETAVRAVNEGRVARFLNKPSDPADITAAIETGLQLYNAAASERELLNKTFVGAVGIFADVMETLQPDLVGRAASAEQYSDQLREQCGIQPRWEYKIASKLALVGFAVQPPPAGVAPTSERAVAHLASACSTAARMVERIPRMEQIAQIIRSAPLSDGDLVVLEPRGDGDVACIGAALLRVALLVEALSHQGIEPDQAEREIRDAMPDAYEPLLHAARAIYPVNVEQQGVPVAIEHLKPGMVLQDNLTRPDGATLLRAGRRLSDTHVDRLQAELQANGELPPVIVTETSFADAYPDAARAMG